MKPPLAISESARSQFQEGFEANLAWMISRLKGFAVVSENVVGRSNSHKSSDGYRFAFPRKASLCTILDEDDAAELDQGVAPAGEIICEHNSASVRKVHDIFIDGITGKNWEGVEADMLPRDIPQDRIVESASGGLTLSKMEFARLMFPKTAKICMAASQQDLENLLADVRATGADDITNAKALADGDADYYRGIRFLRTEQIRSTGANLLRLLPMWDSAKVNADFWGDTKTVIDVLPGLSLAIQIYSRLKIAACRHDESAVTIIEVEQTAIGTP